MRAIDSGQVVTLDSLFPNGFQRQDATGKDSPELMSLRKLRDAQLIRPKGRGQFKDNKVSAFESVAYQWRWLADIANEQRAATGSVENVMYE